MDGRPKSGRCGGYVYYMAKGRQRWHRHVVPKDPRTAGQQRSRAAFGAASKAWSENKLLTEEQRDAWREEAAKIPSSPRLSLCGPLTGQQHFVACNGVKERYGMALLLELPGRGRKKVEESRQNAESTPQVRRPQGVEQSRSETRRAWVLSGPSKRPAVQRGCGRSDGPVSPVAHRQGSGGTPGALRGGLHNNLGYSHLCRYHAATVAGPPMFGHPSRSLRRAEARRKCCFRELWRGG